MTADNYKFKKKISFSLACADVSVSDATPATQIDFDALALVRCSMGANQLYEIILKSIERNLLCVEASITDADRPLHTFVFHPKVLGHLLSYVYPTTPANDGKFTQCGKKHIFGTVRAIMFSFCLFR